MKGSDSSEAKGEERKIRKRKRNTADWGEGKGKLYN